MMDHVEVTFRFGTRRVRELFRVAEKHGLSFHGGTTIAVGARNYRLFCSGKIPYSFTDELRTLPFVKEVTSGGRRVPVTTGSEAYWFPWFNQNWVHYGKPGSPSESVFLVLWNEAAHFDY